ncbi:DNA-binding response regulator [Lentzea guizhouensis]|uniref:DNA-binding response regulator n=1 Tax=Lentzea guizhouensis TaxID=1586287 RepID=A0A1B2HU68_9PSEU|nr:response regulator transcription factor [Lentzea guizhouensis]ANZ41276.1 DNA-binding response regulator [Lentzea guizhouensis]
MIRVLLADDEELIRDALAALLDLEPDLSVVASAGDGRRVDAALAHRPDVAVVDLQMPVLDGLEVTAELARVLRRARWCPDRPRPTTHLQQALHAGARGFLPKGSPGGQLADVIRRVHSGSRWVDPALAADALAAPPCPLTQRELEVLRLSEFGTPVADIAARTSLSPGTVRNHLSAAVAKLGVASRGEAFQVAQQHGWL